MTVVPIPNILRIYHVSICHVRCALLNKHTPEAWQLDEQCTECRYAHALRAACEQAEHHTKPQCECDLSNDVLPQHTCIAGISSKACIDTHQSDSQGLRMIECLESTTQQTVKKGIIPSSLPMSSLPSSIEGSWRATRWLDLSGQACLASTACLTNLSGYTE